MPRKAKKYHYIYRTTCKITNKYYIGLHSASEINDGYLGSGKILKRSVNKYGKDNHIFEILEFCEDRKTLHIKEAEIVNSILLTDPLCMNLATGGSGSKNDTHRKTGWKMPPMSDSHRQNMIIARNNRAPYSEETRKKMSESHKNLVRTDEHKENNRLAVKNSEKFQTKMKSTEHRQIMSDRTKAAHEKRKAAGLPNKGGWCKSKSDNLDGLE